MRTTRSIILKTTTTTNSHATRTKISRLNATATTTPTSSLPTPIPSTPQITIISTIEWSADGFTGFRLDLAPQFFRQNQFKGWTIKVNGMDGSQLMYMEQSSNAINTYQTYINPPFQYRQTDSDVLEWWFQKQPLTFNRTHPLIWRFVLRSAINQAIAVWPERVLDVSGWLQDKSEWYSTSIAGFNSTIIRRKSRWFNQTSHSVASMMSAASSEAGSVYLFRNHAGITVSAAECDTVLFTGIVAVIIGLSMSIVQLARLKIS
jgi:hypothetical protein